MRHFRSGFSHRIGALGDLVELLHQFLDFASGLPGTFIVAGLFKGEITTWNDPKVAADNPGVQLPATAVTPVHRSDESGTTENFTDFLNKAAAQVWTDEATASGRSRAARPPRAPPVSSAR